ncbi:MAG: peptidoglycan editing factor PgeF [Clostridia bacterium]|nr:peptidoglycan editing factor PgeF [Clostridia bacterium]
MDLTNNVIIHTKKDGIEYLQFRKLLEYGLVNCYTTRINDFDLDGRLDKRDTEYNYKRLCESLGIERSSIVRPNQTHSDNIQCINEVIKLSDVDGILTATPGINLALSFADCTPILIYDPVHKVIGNIHSGWKGTAKKIGPKAVKRMQKEYGSRPEDLIVCIGPGIRECHFEVQDDVREIYEKEFSYLGVNSEAIKKEEGKEGKYMIDTTLINKLILEEQGVKAANIYDCGICTVCASSVLHSYRADKEKSGRNVAILGIKN